MSKIKIFATSILIPIVVGVLVGIVTEPSTAYANLQKPLLAPPGWIFPIVWTILYGLMGVSYGLLKSKGLTNEEVDRAYYSQLIVNALWSVLFFTLKWRFVAFVWILLLLILVVRMIRLFYLQDKLAGLLQIPYFIWLLFATYLNLSFYWLNQ